MFQPPRSGPESPPSKYAAQESKDEERGSFDNGRPPEYELRQFVRDAPDGGALEPLYDVLAVLEQFYAAAAPAVLPALKRQVTATANSCGK